MLFSSQIPLIPANIEQALRVEELIFLFHYQTFDSPKFILLHQTFKAARLPKVDCIVLNCTHIEFLAANTQKISKFNVQALNMIVKELAY